MRTVLKPGLFIGILVLLGNLAQSQSTISGRVTDAAGKALEYVSVVLLQDSIFLTGTSTGEKGGFSLAFAWGQREKYTLRVTLIGYQRADKDFIYPDTGLLNHIVLKPDQQVMAGVTVTAKAPLITRKSDRYIVNIENSFLADGNTGLDVLKKSPGIWVDNDGAIRIRGNQPAMIMINDVVQRMSADELAEYLRTLKSEDISRIEIIQNPPAEFEASSSGGIVHIILKRSRKDGLNGSVNAQYRYQGPRPLTGTGISLNYKIKNLSLSAGYSYTKDLRNIKEAASMTYADKSMYNNTTDRREDFNNHQYRLGVVYDISPRHSIGIQSVRTYTTIDVIFNTDIQLSKLSQSMTGTNFTDKDRTFRYGSNTLNYVWKLDSAGSQIKVIADYTQNKKDETNDYLELYSDTLQNAVYRRSMPFITNNYSAQADYTQMLPGKTTLKGGIKYVSVKRDNNTFSENYLDSEWINDTGQTNQFIYTESLLMFYASLEKAIKKTNIQAGLRAEETFSKGNSVTLHQRFSRSYFGLFPSLFITQTLNEKKGHSVYISYSRRLARPSLQYMNPFLFQFNNYTSLIGNSRLLPQYTHNIVTGIRLFQNYSADVFISRTNNVITMSANPGPNNTILYMSENVDHAMDYGLEVSTVTAILKGWTTTNNVSFSHSSFTFKNQSTRQTSFSARSIHNIVLKNIMDIDAEAEYRSPYTYANICNPANFSFDVGFAKRILKSKGRLRLYVADIFNTSREKERTYIDQTTILFYRKRQTRGATLSFTWNFSTGKKFNAGKVEQGNAEERIGS